MSDLPVIGAQLSVLDLDRHRDWLFEKNRDVAFRFDISYPIL